MGRAMSTTGREGASRLSWRVTKLKYLKTNSTPTLTMTASTTAGLTLFPRARSAPARRPKSQLAAMEKSISTTSLGSPHQ